MSARAATRTPAAHRPVASVLSMLGLAHLDRPFDYQVDTDQDAGLLEKFGINPSDLLGQVGGGDLGKKLGL